MMQVCKGVCFQPNPQPSHGKAASLVADNTMWGGTTELAYLGSTAISSHFLVSPPQAAQETCFFKDEVKARNLQKRQSHQLSALICADALSQMLSPPMTPERPEAMAWKAEQKLQLQRQRAHD